MITSLVSGSTRSETKKGVLFLRCHNACVPSHTTLASPSFSGDVSVPPPHLTVVTLGAMTLFYNCSSHALLRDWPRTDRCWLKNKKQQKIQFFVLKGKSLKSSTLKLSIMALLAEVTEQEILVFHLRILNHASLIQPLLLTVFTYGFQFSLPVVNFPFSPLLVLLSKMLLINSGCNK